ncbi:Vps54-domain-containing protein [Punctularia strigosozonata HHB-11173 SS5]|uniref:Vps54-domain-containing protein n=1 Tax=Punctularia strigosozonata (strain HHB-11173) TaxID=741275 RepID=UPI0004418500|nr:Vps54-domain-containing protein [Punctularia strigosozonata HHB-11173 SS5]EIN07187.1 Vps54-domain-containing protein [Punctularia strigosozonata HHB-11173 SS5]
MSIASESVSSPSRPTSPVAGQQDSAATAARPFRFTWDPASRRAGPGSVVSEGTDARGDYFGQQATRHDLLAGSTTSLALGALPAEWSSSKHGFHAISTVLNNPHKRQAPPKAHSHLPTVPPADLPRVRRKDFDSYLRGVTPEWERFQRSTQLGRDGVASLEGPSPGPSTSAVPPTPMPVTPMTPRTPRPQPGRALPPLETVPQVFFEPSFTLGDPRTFKLVTSSDGDDDADPSALSYSLPLLEKLSHHADTIEQHLVREISLRSTSFFAALGNLNDLQTESERCLDRIAHLRGLLKDVDDNSAKKGLEVVSREAKLRNIARMKEGIRMLGGVVDMTAVAKGLVNTGQWGQALEVLDQMEVLWETGRERKRDSPGAVTSPSLKAASPPASTKANGQAGPSTLASIPESPSSATTPAPQAILPISSLSAFSALPSHLQALTLEIAQSLTAEVVAALKDDLVDRISTDIGDSEAQARLSSRFKDRLRPLLHGLVRTRGVRGPVDPWRESVLSQVKEVVSSHLPAGVDVDSSDAAATEPVRNMSHAEFIVFARKLYRTLLNCIEGLQTQNVIIMEVLEPLITEQTPIDTTAMVEDLADILSSATELGNARMGKVVLARSEQHTKLDLPDFMTFFQESWDFVVKCEVICRRMTVGLRGVIVSQAKSFLQAFHQARISQSAEFVHDEQWSASPVMPETQHLVSMLLDASVRDPPEWILKPNSSSESAPQTLAVNGTASTSPPVPPPTSPTPLSPSKPAANGSAAAAKHLRIEDRTYFAVASTVQVLTLLVDYLKVIVNLSMLTTETMSRVIEFMKAWNSRTCQVVLGAGAMRSAGLKNITAKHLALASQSLSIMISLVPYVRETFRRHLSPKQAVMLVEFDKLKRDLQDHQEEIHRKLIQIMGDRLAVHIKDLQAVDWAKPRPGVNAYMEMLVKETVTLHKVLTRWTSQPVVEVSFLLASVLTVARSS